MPTSALPPAESADEVAAWVIGEPPEGLVSTLVADSDGSRSVYYQFESEPNDLADGPIMIMTTSEDLGYYSQLATAEEVTVAGEVATRFELHSDDEHFGTAITWPTSDGRWVLLTWGELVDPDRVLALADTVDPVDGDQWAKMRRTLDPDSFATTRGSDTVEEVVISASTIDGGSYRMVAFLPADFPIGDNDRRQACYRLDLEGVTGVTKCDDHPWWARSGDTTIVYGTVDLEITELEVARIGADEQPVDDVRLPVTAANTSVSSPVAFYATEVPGWCWVRVAAADGTHDDKLGPIGPLPADPHHGDCLAELG